MKLQTLFAVVAVLGGCAVDDKDPEAPAFDRNAPRVDIVTPARGTIAGDVATVHVTGTASDDVGIESVKVNGVPAAVAADGTWVAEVAVTPGTSLLHAIAFDAQGNQGEETRAVVAGPMVALEGHVIDGIQATLSAPAMNALGRGTATFIENGGLMSIVQGMNPVVDAGGGPDCLYSQASITSLTVGDADVVMGPTTSGILVTSVLNDVRVGLHLQWAVSCLNDSRDVVVTAQRVNVQGLIAVAVADRKLDIRFNDSHVQLTGLDVQLPGVPDTVVQMLGLGNAISPILASMTERLVVPMVSQQLAVLDDTRTIAVADAQVDVDVEPTQISFSPRGAKITLDTSLRAHGDSGSYMFMPNSIPTLGMTHGFELAVADDAANQLLTSMWSAKAFDTTLDLRASSYEQVNKLYDTVQLQLLLPPHVSADVRPLELTIGDWIATFRSNDVATTVAIHAKTALYVVEGDDGKLRIDVSTPAVTIDLVDDNDWMTKAQYDAIKAFAVAHITALGSAAVAAIPLPAIGDAQPTNLWVDPDAGYMLVVGDLK
ncbi:MAG TPA: hypothetical protein VIV40_15300 [Kofleriaceae bacterium]